MNGAEGEALRTQRPRRELDRDAVRAGKRNEVFRQLDGCATAHQLDDSAVVDRRFRPFETDVHDLAIRMIGIIDYEGLLPGCENLPLAVFVDVDPSLYRSLIVVHADEAVVGVIDEGRDQHVVVAVRPESK